MLSDELQSFMEVMLQMAEVVINMLDKIVPAVEQIQSYMSSVEDMDSLTSSEYHHVSNLWIHDPHILLCCSVIVSSVPDWKSGEKMIALL